MGHRVRWSSAILGAVIVSLAAFGTADAKGKPSASVTLITPASGAVIQQNDPSTGCATNPTSGDGFVVNYSWSAKSTRAIAKYELVVQHVGSPFSALDVTITAPNYTDLHCNSFVIDSNLANWQWHVLAKDARGKVLADSGPSVFSFAPCRIASGAPCSAP